MPTGPVPPSAKKVQEMAESFGFTMSDADADLYSEMMAGTLSSYRRLDSMQETKPAVKYPRGGSYRPGPEEDPYNAWFVKGEIQGSGDGVLAGLRVGIKDAICVAGFPMINGAKGMEGYIPDIDATVVTRVLDAGGTILGKTNSEDCSFSGGSHTSAYGPVRNPHKPTHSTGASSNGNGAAVAAGDIDVSIGGDQGGSIRIPASWSGIVGLKPTYGLVPYTGAMMIEMTMDHLGPMTDTVENTARMLTAIAGEDPLDPRQRGMIPAGLDMDYVSGLDAGCKGVRVGVLKEGFDHGVGEESWGDTGLPPGDAVVYEKVRAAVDRLAGEGAEVSEVSNPRHEDAYHVWVPMCVEGAQAVMLKGNNTGTNWRGFYNTQLLDNVVKAARARPNDMGVMVKYVLLFGEYMQSDYYGRYYAKAQNIRGQITQSYDDLLESLRRAGYAEHGHSADADPGQRRAAQGAHRPHARHDPQHLPVRRDRAPGDLGAVRGLGRPPHRLHDRRPPLRGRQGAAGGGGAGGGERLAELLRAVGPHAVKALVDAPNSVRLNYWTST